MNIDRVQFYFRVMLALYCSVWISVEHYFGGMIWHLQLFARFDLFSAETCTSVDICDLALLVRFDLLMLNRQP